MALPLRFASLVALSSLAALAACSSPPPPEPAKPEPPPPPPIGLMNATVLVKSCPNVTLYNARMMENALRSMIEPCTKVPGGAAHFTATMLPGGLIQLGSPKGDPAEGVVPTCVVKNQLKHKVVLRKECVFQIHLEERPLTGP